MAEPVNYSIFKKWVNAHFQKIIEKDGKIRINSIFCDDKKYHLYCKPSIGFYKCMKSGKKGTLFDLVMKIEKCSYSQAVDILDGERNLSYFEEKIVEFMNPKKKDFVSSESNKNEFDFPDNSFLISKLGESNHFRIRAENYLKSRKLSSRGLLICVSGEYCNRIIIPYYNKSGDLIYWNSRSLDENAKLRYRGPDSILGAKKEEVVWMQYFPEKGSRIYLTEGEFDAMTLNECGVFGAAFGGASINQKQLEMIKGYQITISFDADKAGKNGALILAENLMSNGFANIKYVRPPKQYKDWNKMLQMHDKDIVKMYIKQKENTFDEWKKIKLNGNF